MNALNEVRRLLDTCTAADILSISPRTLETMRANGEGPRFVRVGRRAVRYLPEDVATWLEAQAEAGSGASN